MSVSPSIASDAALREMPLVRPSARFTLGDLLFFTFGLSVGLAYWRWSRNSWPTALSAAFITWLVVGLVQQMAREGVPWWRQAPMGEDSWGRTVRAVLWAAALALLAAFGLIEITFRRFAAADMLRGYPSIFFLHEIASVVFYLGIMAAFWIPTRSAVTASKWRRAGRLLIDLSLMGVAAYWASKAIANMAAILQLVHIAIRGVINAQPTRWAGHVFPTIPPSPPDATFATAVLGAFAALTFVAAACVLLAARSPRRLFAKAATFLGLMAASLAAIYFLSSAWRTGLYDVSPFFAEAFEQIGLQAAPAAVALIVVLGAGVALGTSIAYTPTRPAPMSSVAPLAFRWPALAVFAASVISELGLELWTFAATYGSALVPISPFDSLWLFGWCSIQLVGEFAANWPIEMISLAAMLVVARYGWWVWKVRDVSGCLWTVQPGQFFLVWAVTSFVLAVLAPLAVCWLLLIATEGIALQ